MGYCALARSMGLLLFALGISLPVVAADELTPEDRALIRQLAELMSRQAPNIQRMLSEPHGIWNCLWRLHI